MYTHTHTHTAGCVQVVLLSLCLVSSLQRLFNCDSDKQSSSVQVWPPPPPERSEGGVSGRGQGGGQQERSSLTQIKDYFSPTTTTWWRWWWCATLTKLIHTVFPHQSETSHLLATVSSEANSPIKLNRKLFRKKKVIGPIEPITLRSKVKHSSRQQGAGLKPGAGLPSR